MISRVIIDKRLITLFRKRMAEAYPNETMMTLWGRVEGDTVIIIGLHTPEQQGTADKLEYNFDDAAGPQAHIHGAQYIGTLHSHPEGSDATPSIADWRTSYASGERLFGIMWCSKQANGKFKTDLQWWEPTAEIQMVHPRIRDANRNKQQAESKAMQVLQEISREDAA